MPLIAMPTETIPASPGFQAETWTLPINGVDLFLYNPYRIVHRSPQTDDQIIINRGNSAGGSGNRWKMSVTFGAVEEGTALATAYREWISDLHDLNNYSDIPLGSRNGGARRDALKAFNPLPTIASISGTSYTLSASYLGGGNQKPKSATSCRSDRGWRC